MDRLYADHGDAALLAEAEALREECIRSGNYRTAEFVAGQIVYHRPQQLRDRHRYAEILLARGDRERAEKDLRELLAERPSDCAAYGLLADVLRSGGRVPEAMEVHGAHLKEHPGDAGALYARASMALWDLRDPSAARAEALRMEKAGSGPGVPGSTRRWLADNASWIAKEADRLERDRAALLAAGDRVDRMLWGGLIAAAAALAGAFRFTRRKGAS